MRVCVCVHTHVNVYMHAQWFITMTGPPFFPSFQLHNVMVAFQLMEGADISTKRLKPEGGWVVVCVCVYVRMCAYVHLVNTGT